MTELTDWLLGQIAADEDEAEHMWGPCDCDLAGFPLQHGLSCKVRVMAECEAKRRIVELAARAADLEERLYEWRADAELGDAILHALALPYADRPGYDESWRP